MTGSESKVGYIQTFLMQKIKVNTVFINSTNIKSTEALVIIKNEHHHFIFSDFTSLLFSLFIYVF